MKKTILTGVIASMMLFVTSAVSAKEMNTASLKTNVSAAPNEATQNNSFNVSFNNEQQVLNIKQVSASTPVQVTITNGHGDVTYTGQMLKGNSRINMTGATTGKYNVRLQDGAGDTMYKLLIL